MLDNNLLNELKKLGVKHNRKNILKIAKLKNNKIVFLEKGNEGSGLQHILDNHEKQFADKGILAEQVPDLLINALIYGKIVGYQSENRPIYAITFNKQKCLIAISVSNNGYIVCANPRSNIINRR